MLNLVKLPGKRGIIGKKVTPQDFKYVEAKLFYALGKQPFFCTECGGGDLDPNDYEDGIVHICPFCTNSRKFGFSFWNPGIGTEKTIDVLLNAEVPTLGTMVVLLEKACAKHGVKINWYVQQGDKAVKLA